MPTLKHLASLTGNSDFLSRRPSILVVDDQVINVQTLYQIFSDDYEVFMAVNGKKALDFCKATPPDLILLDIMMPDMDGLEVCACLKEDELTVEIPVLFVTAQNNSEEESLALTSGGMDFICKPVNPDVVRARVKTHIALKLQRDLLKKLVYTDPLTGLANRRNFDDAYDKEWRYCQRYGKSLAVLMIDIDYFKLYNDTYGHQQGDVCLTKVATCLQAHFGRAHDVVARFGGEEFICLMPECDLSGALSKAEALRLAVITSAIPHIASKINDINTVTLSIGVAVVIPSDAKDMAALVADADHKLYEAKQAGRNRVAA